MSKLAITLYGRNYNVSCDPGEEDQLQKVAQYTESKIQEIASRAGNTTDQHLLVLTCLYLADQLLEAHRNARAAWERDEELLVAAVTHLKQRVAHIASQTGRA